MDLRRLIEGLPVRPREGSPADVRICDVTDDSRSAVPGSLFFARRGVREDARRFVPDAIAGGAVAVLTDDPDLPLPPRARAAILLTDDVPLAGALLAERFYGGPSSRLAVIGVTGTNGKTTTSWIAHAILNGAGVRCGLIGTILVDDGVEVAPASMTTPPACELSRSLQRMVDAGCRAAVLEVSSHALAQKRVAGVRFGAAVFTNLTGEHMDYHGTMEAYAAAKGELFRMLPAEGTAIVNAEDPWSARVAAGTRGRVRTCALHADADCRARVLRAGAEGMMCVLSGPWGEVEAEVPLIGAHNVMNLLQGAAAAHAAGLDREGLARGLRRARPPPGRFEPVSVEGAGVRVLVDYAHSDAALACALDALRPFAPGPPGPSLWVVFGCGGDRDRLKRPRMGRAAAERADHVVVTSDNPRTENPGAIIEDVLAGVPEGVRGKVRIEPDRPAAVRLAVAAARPGDIVLIAGKGHEVEQEIAGGKGGTRRIPMDDRALAREALVHRVGARA